MFIWIPSFAFTVVFPIPFRPKQSYQHNTGRGFGASRSGGKRKHAACDMIAPDGTDVLAIARGKVIAGPYHFYHGAYALEVSHGALGVVRYGEIKKKTPVKVGDCVQPGQVIGHVGKMYKDAMLHFEWYSGNATGPLTDRSNKPFERRSDLLDPTSLLDGAILVSMLNGLTSNWIVEGEQCSASPASP